MPNTKQLNNTTMSAITLQLVQVTPTQNAEVPGFILKLQAKTHKEVETAFGTKVNDSQLTYYMKVAQVAKGIQLVKNPSGQLVPKQPFSAEIDMSQFNIVTRDFTIDDPTSEDDGKTVELKWLQLK